VIRFAAASVATPEWTPEELVDLLAEQGWDGVEWRVHDSPPAPPTGSPGFWEGNRATWPTTGILDRAAAIGELTRGRGLVPVLLTGYASVAELDAVDVLLGAAAACGAEGVRVRLPAPVAGDVLRQVDAARADLREVAARAARHGVRALIELHHDSLAPSASAAARLVEGLDPVNVGLIYDIGNLVIEGWEDPRLGIAVLGPHLAHVHVKNVAWMPRGDRWEAEWAPLLGGLADIPEVFRHLAASGYSGWITVEDFCPPRGDAVAWWAGNLADVRRTWADAVSAVEPLRTS
jgi:sugar phosphate isomerase/epimerase